MDSEVKRHQDIIDYKSLSYLHQEHHESTSFIHSLYIAGEVNNVTTFTGELYQQFSYDMSGITITNFDKKLNISVFLDNGCSVSIMPKHLF